MASYNPPNPYVPGAFNPTQFITPSDNITTKFLDENYLRFPFAQGVENFVSINNQGSLNQGGLADFTSTTTPAVFNLPPTITNPILDTATTPLNAVATIGYVLANEQGGGDLLPLDNDWTGVNNFNPNQAYGAVMKTGITLTDNQNNSQGDTDIISYTPTSNKGLCIYSLASSNTTIGGSPQLQLFPDGGLSVLSAQGANGIAELNATGTGGKVILQGSAGVKLQLKPLINFDDYGNLTGSASGIASSVQFNAPSVNFNDLGTITGGSSLSSSINFASPSFNINDFTNNVYQLRSQDTFGFVVQNTSPGGLGTLTLTNGTTPFTTLTSTTTGLTISDPVTLPAQTTYTPSTTYGDFGATQQFVQLALASQGSGDVTLGGNNPFTGTNTFSGFAGTASNQSYPQSDNQFVTSSYVANFSTTPYPTNILVNYVSYTNLIVQIDPAYNPGLQGSYIGNSLISIFPVAFPVLLIVGNSGDTTNTIYFTTTTPIANPPFFNVSISGTATYQKTLQQVSFTGTLDDSNPYLITLTASSPIFQSLISLDPTSGYDIYFSTFTFNQTPP